MSDPSPADTRARPPRRPINAKADRHFVTALARGLDVLGAFRSRDRMLGNQELARRCGLPKSTIFRLTGHAPARAAADAGAGRPLRR